MRNVGYGSLLLCIATFGCAPGEPELDVILRNGTVYDGSGGPPRVADVGIRGDRITAIGDLGSTTSQVDIDVEGLVVAPGFINMLSWAGDRLIADGRSQSDIRQGVTLEVFGEGTSGGPLSEEMKESEKAGQGDIQFDIEWTTFGEYLTYLETKGISTNVASFVGATTIRIHELGEEDRPPTPVELERMKALVRQSMEEGALGVGSSLIYAPAFYADTDELVALSQVAAEYGGRYISHIRSESNQLLEAVDELLTIAREADIGAEIYHLKAAGADNFGKLDEVIVKVEAARDEGLDVTANMYAYTAGSTGLDAAMPPDIQEGGYAAWAERLQDPEVRARVALEMVTPTDKWENLYLASGGASGTLLVSFKNEELKPLTGKTLAEVAEMRGTSPEETAMDLVVEDGSRVQVVYFLMSDDNVTKKVGLPWMAFGSDTGSMAPEGVFLKSSTHPRAYGNFARLLGKYVRDEEAAPLEDVIRRLTLFPAENLKLDARGRLEVGYYADVVVFDPQTIRDHATYDEPHRYATGMQHVFVNGVAVLRDGEHTGALPGRFVPGPGYKEAR